MQSGAPSNDPGVSPGAVLAGKYRVERVLGAGGMGVVVAAYHLQLGQLVAVKLLLPATLQDPAALARFDREARAAARIRGEHVARVLDVGRLDSGAPYLVMEYLEGMDLAAWLAQRGPLPVELAVDFVLQACEAVAEAHSIGIIHRDLKPANLFCVRRPDGLPAIKVLDFGISKVASSDPSAAHMTSTSAVVGSPLYMSPEQMRSTRDVDARGDVWALGVVLYELLCGRPPFLADAMPTLVLRIAHDPAPPVRSYRGDVPAALEVAVSRCLVKDREGRHGSVAVFAAAIAPFGTERGRISAATIKRVADGSVPTMMEGAVTPMRPAGGAALETTQAESSWGQSRPQKDRKERTPSRGRDGTRARVGLVAMTGAVAVTVLLLGRRDPGPEVVRAGRDGAGADGDGAAHPGPLVTLVATVDANEGVDAAPVTTDAARDDGGAASLPPPPASTARNIRPTGAVATARSHDCDVNHYFDEEGNLVFKKQCL